MRAIENLRVVFLNPSRSWGGAEKSSFSVAHRLSKKALYRVFYRTGMVESAIPAIYRNSTLDVGRIDISPWFPFKKPAALFRDVVTVKKFITDFCGGNSDFTVFFGIMHYASFLLSFLRKISPGPFGVIASPRGPLTPFIKHMVKDPLERFGLILATRFFCKFSDLVLTPSMGTWNDLVKNYGAPASRGRVVPNFVELPSEASKTSLYDLPERPRVCWVGRLDRERNVEQLLNIFARISRSVSGSLIIVGDGPHRSIVENFIEAEAPGSRVFFAGFREDVSPFLGASDIFVHTCLFDGCPNSLLEACAAGLAVVAQNCPYGPAEILDGGKYGILVNSEAELEYALKELLTDEALRRKFSSLARERAAYYSAEKTVSGYESVIDEVFRKRRGH
ncbi:glycosyltransferase [Thermodesulforhabdus norvegica]|uniref:Glycosyltransferase involved in cell wall bisynthesis n=1 Tax=Thermodesulforhabdus norvegica TaxID=39841 RepID=A0A1I4UZZ1_9BACT|nr:glycosyltransferase [Thermodesulforhabdus norvegica]SFM94508.1 Glycosyltransferase involved in cell wall bisynthesis [Thermodesulforhabdus norvegica]